MRETRCGFPSSSQSLKEWKEKVQGGEKDFDIWTFWRKFFLTLWQCDILRHWHKFWQKFPSAFPRRHFWELGMSQECSIVRHSFLFSLRLSTHPNPLNLERAWNFNGFNKRGRSGWTLVRSRSHWQSKSCGSLLNRVKGGRGQWRLFRLVTRLPKHNHPAPFSMPLLSRQNFPPLALFATAPTAPVVARGWQRCLLRKFFIRVSWQQLSKCPTAPLHGFVKLRSLVVRCRPGGKILSWSGSSTKV